MKASNTVNVNIADSLFLLVQSFSDKAEKAENKRIVLNREHLNVIKEGLDRLCMLERHLHNLTSSAYEENNTVTREEV